MPLWPTKTACSLLCIRHGVTEMNEYLSTNRFGSRGFVDPPLYDTRLTARGREQASIGLRNRLEKEHEKAKIDTIISSPLSRALATADLGLGDIQNVKCEVDRDIAERHYLSSDVGRPPSELARDFPRFSEALLTLPDNWWWQGTVEQANAAYTERLALQGGPGTELKGVALPVEPQAHFIARIMRFRDKLVARQAANPEERIAVVAHWGVHYSLLHGASLRNCEVVEARPADLAGVIKSPPDAGG